MPLIDKRRELHTMITNAVATYVPAGAVYYQPPEGFKLSYPCIVYDLEGIWDRFGSGVRFAKKYKYNLTLITKDPESPVVEKILSLPYTALNRVFTTDNLYHYTFTIFY